MKLLILLSIWSKNGEEKKTFEEVRKERLEIDLEPSIESSAGLTVAEMLIYFIIVSKMNKDNKKIRKFPIICMAIVIFIVPIIIAGNELFKMYSYTA